MADVRTPRILVDTSRFPLVVQRFTKGFDDDDIESMIRRFELLFHGGARYALLVYCDPDAQVVSARQRKRVSQWYEHRKDVVRAINVGTAVVIESALVRGAVTALNWLIEPISVQRNVASVREGIDYCIARLEEAHIEVPPEVFALREASDHKLRKLA